MVVAAKWIGTEEDRKDMKRLNLEQVVRVRSLNPFLITLTHTACSETLADLAYSV
jgi:hypothetical protein